LGAQGLKVEKPCSYRAHVQTLLLWDVPFSLNAQRHRQTDDSLEFGKLHDTTDHANLLQTCYGFAMGIWGNWCNGFWPLSISADVTA